jgi:uncharacterized protein YbjT (DUF2867 family)
LKLTELGSSNLPTFPEIGANAASGSSYIRSRGQGELAVQAAFPGAILIRPTVMFAPDDAFPTVIRKLLRRLPLTRCLAVDQRSSMSAQHAELLEVAVVSRRRESRSTPFSPKTCA